MPATRNCLRKKINNLWKQIRKPCKIEHSIKEYGNNRKKQTETIDEQIEAIDEQTEAIGVKKQKL